MEYEAGGTEISRQPEHGIVATTYDSTGIR